MTDASGPLGIPRPLADVECQVVIYMRGVGRPENPREKVIEMEKSFIENTKYVESEGRTTFTNLPTSPAVSNTVEFAVGIKPNRFISMDGLKEVDRSMRSHLIEEFGVSSIQTSFITAGDPKEVIK